MENIDLGRLKRLRQKRDRLLHQLTEVNAAIDDLVDGTSAVPAFVVSSDGADLVQYLRDLHVRAGAPSARFMASGCGVSHTSISEVLRGTRIPSWRLLWPIGRYLGAEEAILREMWAQLQVDRYGNGT